MTGISDVVEKMVTSVLLDRGMPWQRHSRADWVLAALSVLLSGAGVILSVIAVERFFEASYQPDISAAMTAVIAFGVSVIIMLLSRRSFHSKARRVSGMSTITQGDIKEILDILYQGLEEPVRDNPKTAVLLAAIAGYLASRCHS